MRLLTLSMLFVLLAACGGGGDGAQAPDPVPAPAPPPPGANDPLEVQTSFGKVRGIDDGPSQAFLGIPYAAPPVGERRWADPEPARPWTETLQANRFGSLCPQPEAVGSDVVVGDEDCLYLNIWRPTSVVDDPSAAPLPVMVFIHGGGNLLGGAAESLEFLFEGLDSTTPAYEGPRLADLGQALVVTLNFRLAALGFLTHPDLTASSPTGTSGNYGLLDQILALQWVQDEIAAFGGDPDRVMVFGQSGGSLNTCSLLASPLAAGLFQRAGLHSGGCDNPPQAVFAERAEALFAEVGCSNAPDVAACLRQQPAASLVLASAAQPIDIGVPAFGPTTDGRVLLESPDSAFSNGRYNKVPVLIGANAAEYAHKFEDVPESQLPAFLGRLLPLEFLDEALQIYSPGNYGGSSTDAYVAALSDRNILCPQTRYASALAGNQTDPVYLYLFDQGLSDARRRGDGAFHAAELLYLFQHMIGDDFDATDDDRTVQDLMGRYWTGFAATGEAAGNGPVEWSAFDDVARPYLRLMPAPRLENGLRVGECDLWQRVRDARRSDRVGTPDETRISPVGQSFIDLEVLSEQDLITFQYQNEVWVSALDPETGGFVNPTGLDQKADEDLQPVGITFNGPEFGVDGTDPWALYYSRLDDGDVASSQIWRAAPDGNGGFVREQLTSIRRNQTALVSKSTRLPSAQVVYLEGGRGPNSRIALIDEAAPEAIDYIDAEQADTTHPAFEPGTRAIYFVDFDELTGERQVFRTDFGSDVVTRITGDAGNKSMPVVWEAPEFGGALRLALLINDEELGIYAPEAPDWRLERRYPIPPQSLMTVMTSPEIFLYRDRSYIAVNINDRNQRAEDRFYFSEIWVMGAGADLVQRCDDGGDGWMRYDPEPYVAGDRAYVLYNLSLESGSHEIHRCELDLP
jgi:para-nitrobenzyl esterase